MKRVADATLPTIEGDLLSKPRRAIAILHELKKR